MATPVSSLNEWVLNMEAMCDVSVVMAPLKIVIEGWRLINFMTLSGAISEGTRNEMLKNLTTQVVAVNPDVNCYPMGYNTGLLFDIDGNPIP